MIEEVESCQAKLQITAFPHGEGSRHGEVGVEERRAVSVGLDILAIRSSRRQCEACRIEVLMRPETRLRVALEYRLQVDIWCAENRLRRDAISIRALPDVAAISFTREVPLAFQGAEVPPPRRAFISSAT